MKNSATVRLTGTALCLALGLVLPFFFHLFGVGQSFLPMHIPVLLCGFLFGWPCGAVCGLVLPLLSSVLTGMPPLYPTAAAMMLELGAYGALTGLLYQKRRWNVYPSLVAAMIGGRLVSGAANALFYGIAGNAYGLTAFLTASFVTALPGIVIQLLLIPALVLALKKADLIPYAARPKTKRV